jgi:hypothetical protein
MAFTSRPARLWKTMPIATQTGPSFRHLWKAGGNPVFKVKYPFIHPIKSAGSTEAVFSTTSPGPSNKIWFVYERIFRLRFYERAKQASRLLSQPSILMSQSQPKNLLVVSPWVVSLSFEYSRNYKLSIRINPPRKSNSFYRLTYLLMNLTCLLVAEGWFFQFLICPPSLLEMVTRPYNSNLLD